MSEDLTVEVDTTDFTLDVTHEKKVIPQEIVAYNVYITVRNGGTLYLNGITCNNNCFISVESGSTFKLGYVSSKEDMHIRVMSASTLNIDNLTSLGVYSATVDSGSTLNIIKDGNISSNFAGHVIVSSASTLNQRHLRAKTLTAKVSAASTCKVHVSEMLIVEQLSGSSTLLYWGNKNHTGEAQPRSKLKYMGE